MKWRTGRRCEKTEGLVRVRGRGRTVEELRRNPKSAERRLPVIFLGTSYLMYGEVDERFNFGKKTPHPVVPTFRHKP